jgi:hypothetical protein
MKVGIMGRQKGGKNGGKYQKTQYYHTKEDYFTLKKYSPEAPKLTYTKWRTNSSGVGCDFVCHNKSLFL